MKKYLALTLIALTLGSCAKKTDTAETVDTLHSTTATNGGAIDQVSGDKEMLRQSIAQAETKGNLTAALIEAARDSVIERRLAEALAAVRVDRETAANTAKSSSSTAAKSKTTTTKSGTSKSTATNGDVLDKTEDAVNKADRAVKKSGDIINKADEVSRRADDILRGRR